MEAGTLDRRIELFRRVATLDEYNDEVVTWQSLGRMWAGCRDISGSEAVRGGVLAAEVTTLFTIRYRPDVRLDFTMKLNYDGQDYEVIRLARLPGRGDGFELACALEDKTGSRGM